MVLLNFDLFSIGTYRFSFYIFQPASQNIYCVCFRPFSFKWWSWLLFTGFMMACCISVKFVGLFTIILIGLRTIEDLWDILGDLKKPFVSVILFVD